MWYEAAWSSESGSRVFGATSVTLAPALTASVPNAHVTRPVVWEQLPIVVVAETNASPAGRTFVSDADPGVGECGAEALEQCGSERVAVERDQADG